METIPIKSNDFEYEGQINIHQKDSNKLQRTEEWFEQRKGNWTGSQFKKCMSCNPKGGRMDWFNKEKVFHFSTEVVKYIYSNAMERKTGIYIETGTTKEMKYGTIIEPLIIKRAAVELTKRNLKVQEVGFKVFENLPTAGVSCDAIILNENDIVIATGEFKACTSWNTHFDRTFELMDDSSIDFWQTQGQMLAWNCNKSFYIVISPPKNIDIYLRCEDINEMYDYWCNETEMKIQEVEASEIHLEALNKRLHILEDVILEFLQNERNLKYILQEKIDLHKLTNQVFIPNLDKNLKENFNTNEILKYEEPSKIPSKIPLENTETKSTTIVENILDDLPF